MELSSLYHKAGSNYAYAYSNKMLHIKLQTKVNDVQAVMLVFGDPYDYREQKEAGEESGWNWFVQNRRMEHIGTDGLHDYWLIEVEPYRRRLRYAFYLESEGLHYLYGERKTYQVTGTTDPRLSDQKNFFAFPYINSVDVYSAPDWVKDTIWYQIFPERFANGDMTNDPKDTKNWNDPLSSSRDHYGGDLQGVIEQLDYLEELGVNGIYFTPIFHSHSNHKYDTIDYLKVDPHFGDKEKLKELVKKAHDRGIRVMLDIVFNHCGFFFAQFQDVLEHGEASAYKDWFHIHEFPVYDKANELRSSKELHFDTFAFTPSMPKLNTENPQMKEYLLNIIRYWSDEAAIDGWRLDVANEVDHQFWREFRKVAKERNPEVYIVGEVWHDANPWLGGDQFDAVMNYPLNDAVLGFFAKQELNCEEFAQEVSHANFQYPKHVNDHMYNLIDSHDTPRFLHQAGENKELLKLAYVFMMTHTGSPSIYYGNEVGMTGGQDPDCRRPMRWNTEDQDIELMAFMKQLIRIRKDHDVLRDRGEFRFHKSEHSDILVYQRSTEKEVYLILINRSNQSHRIRLPEEIHNRSFLDLWRNEQITTEDHMELKPYGFILLKNM
ncbi:MAG: ThMA [Herbinix sp.]|nr:ThMA [Herbinix sp.]